MDNFKNNTNEIDEATIRLYENYILKNSNKFQFNLPAPSLENSDCVISTPKVIETPRVMNNIDLMDNSKTNSMKYLSCSTDKFTELDIPYSLANFREIHFSPIRIISIYETLQVPFQLIGRRNFGLRYDDSSSDENSDNDYTSDETN
jgi:hypothetical protein